MTIWSNSLNATQAGVQTVTNGLWSGSTFSEYSVLYGADNNNDIIGLAPSSSSGYVLTNTGNPSPPAWLSQPNIQMPWSVITATSQNCILNQGYFTNAASQVNMYFPLTAYQGNELRFANLNAGFAIIPYIGQTINFLSQEVTFPSYLYTTVANAAMDLICTTANTSWNVVNNEGTFSTALLQNHFVSVLSEGNLVYLKIAGTSALSAWGSGTNSYGCLGNQTLTAYSSPVATVGGQAFRFVSAAGYTVAAIAANGSCWTWGNGTGGALGNLSTTSHSSPVSVVGNFSFVSVAVGGIATGNFCAGLTASGTVWTWGPNPYGNLGNNNHLSFSSPISVVGNHSFIQISAGYGFMAGLKANGQCWVWGLNTYGNLGTNNLTSYSSPVQATGNHSFIQISCGTTAMYGLKVDGSCWGWGSNSASQLGTQSATTSYSSPVSVVGNHSFIQISGSYINCYGLKSNGQVWGWGNNASGQIGNQTGPNYSSPVSVVGPFTFVQLGYCGNDNSNQTMSAWLSTGQLWAWGQGTSGQLGNDTKTNVSSPILVLNTP